MHTDNTEQEILDILAMTDPQEYPETYNCLSDAAERIEDDEFDAYGTAEDLLQCDRPGDLPEYVIDLVTGLLQECIDDGDEEAMNCLGAQYYDGFRGFEQSYEKAFRYYTMAAEHGSRIAQENLGYCWYYGRTGTVDYEKAFHYFALGAFDGHIVSLYKIGDMYAAGRYVERNDREAFSIYSRCLETMTDEAAPRCAGPVFLRVAGMLLDGRGVEADAKAALVCFQKAETFLYDMVRNGDSMYAESLQAAVDGQTKARERLRAELEELC